MNELKKEQMEADYLESLVKDKDLTTCFICGEEFNEYQAEDLNKDEKGRYYCDECKEKIIKESTVESLLTACEKEDILERVNLNAFAVELLGEENINKICLKAIDLLMKSEKNKTMFEDKVEPFIREDEDWYVEYILDKEY